MRHEGFPAPGAVDPPLHRRVRDGIDLSERGFDQPLRRSLVPANAATTAPSRITSVRSHSANSASSVEYHSTVRPLDATSRKIL